MMLAVGIYLVLISARDKFCIDPWMEVYLVLEEDGTEVDDEEYFQTLPDNTMFMLLFIQVSPFSLAISPSLFFG